MLTNGGFNLASPDGAADSIRQPVVAPDRDVRPFQDVLIEIGARLGLPGFVTTEGEPRYPGGYPDYIVNHERRPGVGPLGRLGNKVPAVDARRAAYEDVMWALLNSSEFVFNH